VPGESESESEWIGIEPLEYLWVGSKKIVSACTEIQFEEARRFIGERCFRRIMLMTLTFLLRKSVHSLQQLPLNANISKAFIVIR
jgi:hypothetical protein